MRRCQSSELLPATEYRSITTTIAAIFLSAFARPGKPSGAVWRRSRVIVSRGGAFRLSKNHRLTFPANSMILPLLPPQNLWRVEASDRSREVCRDVAGKLEVQIAGTADAEERGEVAEIMAGVNRLVVQPGNE